MELGIKDARMNLASKMGFITFLCGCYWYAGLDADGNWMRDKTLSTRVCSDEHRVHLRALQAGM